jgi:hypothetical protein
VSGRYSSRVAIGVVSIVLLIGVAFVVAVVRPDTSQADAALSDGHVTFEEYQASAERVLTCADAAGVDADFALRPDLSGKYFGYETVADTPEDNEAGDQALDACLAKWGNAIESAWVAQNAITIDRLPAALELFVGCMEDRATAIPQVARDEIAAVDMDRAPNTQIHPGRWLQASADAYATQQCVERASLGNLSDAG